MSTPLDPDMLNQVYPVEGATWHRKSKSVALVSDVDWKWWAIHIEDAGGITVYDRGSDLPPQALIAVGCARLGLPAIHKTLQSTVEISKSECPSCKGTGKVKVRDRISRCQTCLGSEIHR